MKEMKKDLPKIQEQTSTIRPTPRTHLSNLQILQASQNLINRQIDRSSTRIADHKVLRRAELVEVRQVRAVDGGCFGFAVK